MIHSSELILASPALDRHVRTTYLIGLAPALFSFALAISIKGQAHPLAWGIFGLSLATLFLLYGFYGLCDTDQVAFKWARRLKKNPDAWLAKVIILSRNIFFVMCFGIAWMGINQLDVEFNTFLQTTFILALISWPIRNLSIYANYAEMPRWRFMLSSMNRSLSVITLILFVTALVSEGIKPESGTSSATELPLVNIGLWIPAIFLIILNVLILLDDFLRFEEKTKF